MNKLVFISYRREDEGPATRFFKAELDKIFGPEHVFMDYDNIRSGMDWEELINKNIEACDVLVVVMGKKWLQLHDSDFRRRIDNKNDWVRREIEIALERKIPILPLLLGASDLSKKALPAAINKLAAIQSFTLSAMTWQQDVTKVAAFLEKLGFTRKEKGILMPSPDLKKPAPLEIPEELLEQKLKALPEWSIVTAPIPGEYPNEANELHRRYIFDSYESAVEFISGISKSISIKDHHPRWMNVWRTVLVYITSWDIGHKISYLDLELAMELDKFYEAAEGKADE